MSDKRRKRGFVLTLEGLQKFLKVLHDSEFEENYGNKYTYEELKERTRIDPQTIRRVLACKKGVDLRTLEHLFIAFNLELTESCYSQPNPHKRQDWGEAICVELFYGRTEELAMLEQWLLKDRCRLVALLGMGGIGKTTLSIKLAQQIESKFDCVIWKSLRDAPPVEEILANLIEFLSEGQETKANLPERLCERITRLINYLRSLRCLIVLDNAESLLDSGSQGGKYCQGYEGYGELLRRVGQTNHISCLMLTAREKPKEVAILEGESLPVSSLQIKGFREREGQEIFQAKKLSGSELELNTLSERYGGNPLALKVVATTIQDLFEGNIAEFLAQEKAVFGNIRDVLDQQFKRLSDLEKQIMYWLAIAREPISLSQLREDLVLQAPTLQLVEALESLSRRCLIEKNASRFTQQPVVMEYVTSRLIEGVCEEIVTGERSLFRDYALIKATAKDYVRETQIRLILQPVLDGLFSVFKCKQSIEERLSKILETQRENSPRERGYLAGNIINLFCQMETDLRSHDFSSLCVWQADLRNACLHDVNFQNVDLAKSVFAETFGGVLSVAFSPNGKILATGDTNGEIYLRRMSDGQPILTFQGHNSWVVSVTFSPDGTVLTSGSADSTVKLWDVETGQCLQIFQGHDKEVWSVAFSPDGTVLASGSDDQTVKLWSISTGECLKTFQGHTSWVHSVGFSLNGQTLASGSDDQTVKLWDVSTGECLKTLQGHRDGIRAIAISPDDRILASSSEDQTVKLWDVSTGECLKTLQGHYNEIYSVAFNPQGDLLASGSHDQTVKLWDVSTGECLKTLQGHSSWVYSVAFNPQGNFLVSGSYDQTARLWSVHTNQCLRKFQGYTNQVLSVVFSPDGETLASGSQDSSVRLWNVSTSQALKTFQGHSAAVWSVAFSPDGQTLISSSEDQTIRLWDVAEGKCLKIFQGHSALVWSVTFSPDGQTLASSSEDQTVRLWDVKTGQVLKILQGHSAAVWSVAFSPDGQTLASGSHDQTVKLWNIRTGKCLKTLADHTAWVWSVAFSPDGKLLASTSPDGTIRLWSIDTNECFKVLQVNIGWLQLAAFSPDSQILACSNQDFKVELWDIRTGKCLKTFPGHTGRVWSITFDPYSRTLASSGEDETIKLWDLKTGNCLKTVKAEKPYEHMNIKGFTGLSPATVATLKLLGALE